MVGLEIVPLTLLKSRQQPEARPPAAASPSELSGSDGVASAMRSCINSCTPSMLARNTGAML